MKPSCLSTLTPGSEAVPESLKSTEWFSLDHRPKNRRNGTHHRKERQTNWSFEGKRTGLGGLGGPAGATQSATLSTLS